MRRGNKCSWLEFWDISHNMFLHWCHREGKPIFALKLEGGFRL